MCGIAGYYGTNPPSRERLEECIQLIEHRGPDHHAVEMVECPSGRSLCLLHSRLSIIDLDPRANQPFTSGGKYLIYNGEIYNYVELRKTMKNAGSEFITSCDTEVLFKHLAMNGIEQIGDCEGMWAFAYFDESAEELILCRDRFGEKPLYILRVDHGVYFASEVKCLRALHGELAPNHDHLKRYLVNGYKSLYKTRETFFRDVTECPPGSWMKIRADNTVEEKRYWRPEFRPVPAMSYEEAVAGTRERLLRAVELRLRADVPLAFCLSGGVDSNALTAIAKRIHGYDVHGFTITSKDVRYDEEEIVKKVVNELGIKHTMIQADTSDFLGRLRSLVKMHDAPVYTITYYAHWLIERSLAEHGYRVSLSGTAADELYSGYYDHHLAYLREMHGTPGFTEAKEGWERNVKPNVRNPHLSNPELFIRNPDFRDHIYLFADRFEEFLHEPLGEPFREERYCDDLLRNRMLNELQHESVPVILHEDDANAMSFSIENRSPFLDSELCDFAYSIPTRHLIQKGVAKAVLRDAIRGIVPDVVLDDPRKVGFNLPIHAVLDVDRQEIRDDLLSDSPVYNLVKREKIAELLDKKELPNSESKFLFYFVNAKLFLEEHSC